MLMGKERARARSGGIGGRFARGGVEYSGYIQPYGGALRMILLEEPGASGPAAGPLIENKNPTAFLCEM